MKTDHGKNIEAARLLTALVLVCLAGLLTPWLLATTSSAASQADQSLDPSPTTQFWFPSVYKAYHMCSDQYERNNSASTAYLIGAGSAINETLRANFCAGDPDDIYKIDAVVTGASALVVDLTSIAADTDLDLYLYDGQLSLVARSDSGGAGASERIEYRQISTGIYYVRVYPFRVPQNGDTRWYNLQVRLN